MAKNNNSRVSNPRVIRAWRRRMSGVLSLFAAAALAFTAVVLYAARGDSGQSGIIQRVRHAAVEGAWFTRTVGRPPAGAREAAPAVAQASSIRAVGHGSEADNPFNPGTPVRTASSGARGPGGAATEAGVTTVTGEESSTDSAAPAEANPTGEVAAWGAGASAGNVTAQQAQNQLAKVSRGLSAAAQGGVLVNQVLASSVAGQLGLQQGDLIVAVNGQPINSPAEFAQIYEQDGTPRQIDAVRGGRAIHLHP